MGCSVVVMAALVLSASAKTVVVKQAEPGAQLLVRFGPWALVMGMTYCLRK